MRKTLCINNATLPPPASCYNSIIIWRVSSLVSRAVVIAVGNIAHQSQLTYNRPRAMLPALGKPLVVRIMDRLYRAGIQEYVVVVGEDEGAVAAYLNQHWAPNVSIEFIIQSKEQNLAKTLADIVAATVSHLSSQATTASRTFILSSDCSKRTNANLATRCS